MEFWLNYIGAIPIKASVEAKHSIRRCFHQQLKRLWECHPALLGATHGSILAAPLKFHGRCLYAMAWLSDM